MIYVATRWDGQFLREIASEPRKHPITTAFLQKARVFRSLDTAEETIAHLAGYKIISIEEAMGCL